MNRALLLLAMAGAVVTAGAQTIVTPVIVHKDGEASAVGYTGSEKDILVDGAANQVVGWLTFQTDSIDMSGIDRGELVLYVKAVESPGVMRVHALDSAVDNPEIHMTLADINYAVTATDSVSLASADIETIIRLDITSLLTGAAFHGVALTSDDGLRASFDAKEGRLQPHLLLTHTAANTAHKWHAGNLVPSTKLGGDGDMYLLTTSGDVYQKSGVTWNLVANIQGAPGAGFNWLGTWGSTVSYAANDAVFYLGSSYIASGPSIGDVPTDGSPWTMLVQAGTPGTSSWTDGTDIVTTTKNVGINVTAPSERLEVGGNMKVTGDLEVGGEIRGAIDISQLSGPAVQQYSPSFPAIMYNTTQLQVEFYGAADTAVVVYGPGIVIDRIVGYLDGHRLDHSGLSSEHDFVVELYPSEAPILRAYFDAYAASPRTTQLRGMSLVTHWLWGEEFYRWNFFEFKPLSYTDVPHGNRTRFTFRQSRPSNNIWECQLGGFGDFGYLGQALSLNYPTETQAVEIGGVIASFCPEIVIDTVALTVTFTHYAYESNDALYNWTRLVVAQGTETGHRKNMSIIDLAPITGSSPPEYGNTGCYEAGRKNYFECFPIEYQMIGGYRMPEKLRERVVLAYCWREDG